MPKPQGLKAGHAGGGGPGEAAHLHARHLPTTAAAAPRGRDPHGCWTPAVGGGMQMPDQIALVGSRDAIAIVMRIT